MILCLLVVLSIMTSIELISLFIAFSRPYFGIAILNVINTSVLEEKIEDLTNRFYVIFSKFINLQELRGPPYKI